MNGEHCVVKLFFLFYTSLLLKLDHLKSRNALPDE